jgi:8-oxo-dGTP pyrophosphatase MutT (NUDIX family)
MWFPHVTVAAICERKGQFLMVEEYSKSLAKRVINQPAGHLEENESLLDAVRRETLEETCYHFTPRHLIGIYRSKGDFGRTYLRFAFSGEVGDIDSQAERDSDILACHWMTAQDILAHQSQRSELVGKSLRDYLNGVRYPLDIFDDPIDLT